MSLFVIFMLAVGLSMDAFSLSLIYGTLDLSRKRCNQMSIMVGIFHFFMPLLGYQIGELILKIIKVNPDIIVGIIFLILGIEMIVSTKKEEQVKLLTTLISVIFFAFTVSIDSFSIGIGFGVANIQVLLPCVLFSMISAVFTKLGISLGKKLSNQFGSITTIIGAIILGILGLTYIF